VEASVKGHDDFAVLPMGYSVMASLGYGCLPIVFDKLLGAGGENCSIDAPSE